VVPSAAGRGASAVIRGSERWIGLPGTLLDRLARARDLTTELRGIAEVAARPDVRAEAAGVRPVRLRRVGGDVVDQIDRRDLARAVEELAGRLAVPVPRRLFNELLQGRLPASPRWYGSRTVERLMVPDAGRWDEDEDP
jgi:hypothetical protein